MNWSRSWLSRWSCFWKSLMRNSQLRSSESVRSLSHAAIMPTICLVVRNADVTNKASQRQACLNPEQRSRKEGGKEREKERND
jgi:hypothetical protein